MIGLHCSYRVAHVVVYMLHTAYFIAHFISNYIHYYIAYGLYTTKLYANPLSALQVSNSPVKNSDTDQMFKNSRLKTRKVPIQLRQSGDAGDGGINGKGSRLLIDTRVRKGPPTSYGWLLCRLEEWPPASCDDRSHP